MFAYVLRAEFISPSNRVGVHRDGNEHKSSLSRKRNQSHERMRVTSFENGGATANGGITIASSHARSFLFISREKTGNRAAKVL